MELQGKIIAALEPRSGQSRSTGNPWKVQTFVLETHDQYPKKLAFDVFGEDKLKNFNISVGEEIKVSFDIDAHEYQGRWFNSVRAWAVDRPAAGGAAAPAAAAAPAPAAESAPFGETPAAGGGVDDLPF